MQIQEWYNIKTHARLRQFYKPAGFDWVNWEQYQNDMKLNKDLGVSTEKSDNDEDDCGSACSITADVVLGAIEPIADALGEALGGTIVDAFTGDGGTFGGGGSSGNW